MAASNIFFWPPLPSCLPSVAALGNTLIQGLGSDRQIYLKDVADIEIVGEAKNGREALQMIDEKKPDLVFLDVEMPGMTGLEVCQRIRQMPQGESIPIMIVTGSETLAFICLSSLRQSPASALVT